MSCSVSKSFEAENKAEINNTSVSTLNATFELSAQDISLVSKKDFLKNFFCRHWVIVETGQACLWQRWMNLTMKLHRCLLVIHHIARDQKNSMHGLCCIRYTARYLKIREKRQSHFSLAPSSLTPSNLFIGAGLYGRAFVHLSSRPPPSTFLYF